MDKDTRSKWISMILAFAFLLPIMVFIALMWMNDVAIHTSQILTFVLILTVFFAGFLVHVFMHEIGHVFGMGHVSDSTSLMYTYQTTITSLSSADRAVIDSFY